MRTRTVTFAAPETLFARAKAQWAEPILACWPRHGSSVSAEFLTVEQFAARTELARPGIDRDPSPPALIVYNDGQAHAPILQLLDGLQRQLVPAVLLFPELDDHALQFQGGGVI